MIQKTNYIFAHLAAIHFGVSWFVTLSMSTAVQRNYLIVLCKRLDHLRPVGLDARCETMYQYDRFALSFDDIMDLDRF